jgi:AraC-like DNA-binding protein
MNRWKEIAAALAARSDNFWHDMDFEPMSADAPPPELQFARSDGVAVSKAVMPALRTSAGRRPPQAIYVVSRANEESTLVAEGREPLRLAPGEFVIGSTETPGRWTVNGAHTVCSIHVESALFREHFAEDPDGYVARRLRMHPGLREVLGQLMDTALSISEGGSFEAAGRPLVSAFLDLLALSLREDIVQDDQSRTGLDIRRGQIERYIRTAFFDPNLSIEQIAAHLGVTPRYVQLAMAAGGSTPTRYLKQLRLEASKALLDVDRGKSITEVAFECGFGSSAHFATEFRKQYGVSPRAYRRSGRQAFSPVLKAAREN